MRICYIPSRYKSLARVAADYMTQLGSCYELSCPEEAEAIIVHCLPREAELTLQRMQLLRERPLIGYFVWEATELPESFRSLLSCFSEVWTCSSYCRKVFEKWHPRVVQIPVIVHRDKSYASDDLDLVKTFIRYTPENHYFLTITSLSDKRKNVVGLIDSWRRISDRMPRARLVVKSTTMRDEVLPPKSELQHPTVLHVCHRLSHAQINALYDLSCAYVSAHHSEGWGLTLSDAMLFHKPVIATGYSGNMDYMNARNSYPVAFCEEYIRAEDRFYLFDGSMKWAYPDQDDLCDQLLRVYDRQDSKELLTKLETAYEDVAKFNQEQALRAMSLRLAQF